MEQHRLSVLLKMLANPERQAILMLLQEHDRYVEELARSTGLTVAEVANHLARLRTEKIVDFTRYHRVLEYRLVSEEASILLDTLRRIQDSAAA